MSSSKETFSEDIAAIAAGEADAIERHIDLLSDDEQARDLRHETTRIASSIVTLGDDYAHPADFEARLLTALDAQEKPVEKNTEKPSVPKQSTQPSKAANSNRSPLLLAGGGVAAAFLLVIGGMQLTSTENTSEQASITVPSKANDSSMRLSAQFVQLQRSGDPAISGVMVTRKGQASAQSFSPGGTLSPGDRVSTDARTRILLKLSDDSTVTLAANSVLLFDAEATRRIVLQSGELVADVAHLSDGPNAIFGLPMGHVEVLGTKFALTADGEYSSVRVSRGIVSLVDQSGSAVIVHAGEEASIRPGAKPQVSPALYISDSMRWSEFDDGSEKDREGSGLGELRAYKPGQSRDTDWPMALQSHRVTVRVVGNIARTEIEEVFRNDSKTVLEGVYTFPLPAGAQIDKLALDVDGKFEEGAIVEKDRAAKIWKGVIAKATHKKPKRPSEIIWVPGPWRDPALLEWKEGNRFQLRIFPIPKEGTRTIKLAYTQVIAPQGQRRRYTYNLPRSADGSSVAEHFNFDMKLGSAAPDSLIRTPGYTIDRKVEGSSTHLHLDQEAFVPNGDLVVDYQGKGQQSELQAWGFQGSAATAPSLKYKGKKRSPRKEVLAEQTRIAADTRAYALIALRPHLPRWTEQKNREIVIVVDSSQSMVGTRYERSSDAASQLIAGLSKRDRVIVMACDLDCQSFGEGALRPSADNARAVKKWLDSIEPAGASFVEHSMEAAAKAGDSFSSTRNDKGQRVVVYIGDGMASMGHRSVSVLGTLASELRDRYNTSFTTVAIGADSDSKALAAIARAGGGYFIEYQSGRNPNHMADAVLETTMGIALRDTEILLPAGLSDASALTLGTIRAGDEMLVTARYSHSIDDKITIRGTVGGKPFENTYPLHLSMASSAGNAFVPKIWASQRIDQLESQNVAGTTDTIVALSKAYGVMSKKTSLLVLESEAMFKAFGVDRAVALSQWTGEEGEADSSESMGESLYNSSADAAYDADDFASGMGKGAGGLGGLLGKRASKTAEQAPPPPSTSLAPRKKRKEQSKTRRPPLRGRSAGSWMRRVWFRTATIQNYSGVPENVQRSIEASESLLKANPDSREHHRNLIQALSYAGELQRAEDVAKAWMQRDRLDPEALSYLADIVAREGRRNESIRLLSGIVDLRSSDQSLHLRLAKAYDRAGETRRACAHRVMIASIDPSNLRSVANAVRCERTNHRETRAQSILASLPVANRGRVKHSALSPATTERIRGDLRIDATWSGNSDLDIAIITPTGKRISWQGGHRRVFAQHVKQTGRETLGLGRIRKGHYLIEVSRSDASSHEAVSGELAIVLLGRRQAIPFSLRSERSVVGRAVVRMESRMESL